MLTPSSRRTAITSTGSRAVHRPPRNTAENSAPTTNTPAANNNNMAAHGNTSAPNNAPANNNQPQGNRNEAESRRRVLVVARAAPAASTFTAA